jgi:Tfp pilus assembly protein PilP
MRASEGRRLLGRPMVSAATLLMAGALAVTPSRAEKQAPAAPPAPAVVPVAVLDDDRPFDPTGRRDPFRPPRANVVTRTGEPPTPLQRYEIGQLKLVAIIYDTTEPRAVVEDDQGLGYIVRVGTAIGANGGRVRNIERGRVLIEEDSVDFYGESHLSNVVMELRTAEGGKQ